METHSGKNRFYGTTGFLVCRKDSLHTEPFLFGANPLHPGFYP